MEKRCSLNLKFGTHLHTFKTFAIAFLLHCILVSGMGIFGLVICSALEFINKHKIGDHVALFINKNQTFHFCHHRFYLLFITWWFHIGCLPICWAPRTAHRKHWTINTYIVVLAAHGSIHLEYVTCLSAYENHNIFAYNILRTKKNVFFSSVDCGSIHSFKNGILSRTNGIFISFSFAFKIIDSVVECFSRHQRNC